MKSPHRRSNFTRRRRISHREAVFHPPERVDFVEKSTCESKCFFLSMGYVKDGFAFLIDGFEPLESPQKVGGSSEPSQNDHN